MARGTPRCGRKGGGYASDFTFKAKNRNELAKRGLSDAAIAALERVVAITKDLTREGAPTSGDVAAAAGEIEKRAALLATLLEKTDEHTRERIEDSLTLPPGITSVEGKGYLQTYAPGILTKFQQFQSEIARLAEIAHLIKAFEKKTPVKRDVQGRLRDEIERVFRQHDIPLDYSAKGATANALRLCREALGMKAEEPWNDIRKMRPKKGR
jgi:hypothetical protein